MRLARSLLGLALVTSGCGLPTGASTEVSVSGALVTSVGSPRSLSQFPFDPAANATGGQMTVTVTGFIPGDLCGQTLAATYWREGTRLFVTLTTTLRQGVTCVAWIAETHYFVTLSRLPPGPYQVFVIENPARRVIDGQAVAMVDTLDLGVVTVAKTP